MASPAFGVARRRSNDVEDAHGVAEVAPELTADGGELLERCQAPMVAGDLRRRLAKRGFHLFEEVARQGHGGRMGERGTIAARPRERHACAVAGRSFTREEWRRFVGDRAYATTC